MSVSLPNSWVEILISKVMVRRWGLWEEFRSIWPKGIAEAP